MYVQCSHTGTHSVFKVYLLQFSIYLVNYWMYNVHCKIINLPSAYSSQILKVLIVSNSSYIEDMLCSSATKNYFNKMINN